ncbi:hypothetical protein Pelo_19147 [Pelomyxa schiedti]|nr:hypothetical protein Pelo_19147 [Pelomyxa schiedti]
MASSSTTAAAHEGVQPLSSAVLRGNGGSGSVEVVVRVNYGTRWGQHVHCFGQPNWLGSWDPKRAPSMVWNKGNMWEITLKVELASIGLNGLLYKYAILEHDKPDWGLPHIEPGLDRLFKRTRGVNSPNCTK